MSFSKNKYIYLLAISMTLIISPFYESVFPLFFPLYSHLIYISVIGGIILYTLSIIRLQKQYGFKPRIYPLLLDGAFVRELFSQIRQDIIAITLFTLDIVLFAVGFFVMAIE
jgi:hypothetical protein